MPLAWAARPIFKEDGHLDLSSNFSALYKHESEKLKDEEFIKMLTEYHRHHFLGMKSKFKGSIIKGSFKAKLLPHEHDASTTVLSPSLMPLKTPSYLQKRHGSMSTPLPMREVVCFQPKSKTLQTPHSDYYDFVFVYPMNVNFSGKKAAANCSARNIAVRVQVVEDNGKAVQGVPPGIRCLFGKSSGPAMVSSILSSVSYHNRTPVFQDEIKIKIPVTMNKNYHLFFTFHHVHVDDAKKGNKPDVCTTIGYSWLPLLSPDTQTLVHDGEYDLMVASGV